tara:strand:- start:5501 stop:5926 length:426 start_codon:yes stop_codon:yes gene_type:complete
MNTLLTRPGMMNNNFGAMRSINDFPGFRPKIFANQYGSFGNSPMFMRNRCTPTTFYLVFAGIQIFMDLVNGIYQSAMVKLVIAVVFSTLLNILCMRNLGVVSWLLVFMPFILTTLISALVLDSMNQESENISTDYINFNII